MKNARVAQVAAALPDELPVGRRFVVALAGPPAAGKSTLAAQLRDELSPRAAVLGLDAFHYDNEVLALRGDLPRKGAPHTFDVDGYLRLLATLRDTPGESIPIPRFDRDLDLARNAAEIVSPQHSILITEGNYLLLRDEPWASLREIFDLTVFVTSSIDVIETRILERWRSHGLTDAQAKERFVHNDEPNATLTLGHSHAAMISIRT